MIRPRPYHPQANLLIRQHAAANAQRFHGTEADSSYSPASSLDSDDSDWPTTKRFARTLTGVEGAYPGDPSYMSPFERFEQQLHEAPEPRSLAWADWVIFAILVGVVLAFGMGWLKW